MKKKKVRKVITRRCSVCGKELKIVVYEDGTYEGGHYFGNLKKLVKEYGTYDSTIPNEEYEYWECNECALNR